MTLKLNLSSLKADGAKVELQFTTQDGAVVAGHIEQTFFEEFAGTPNVTLTPARKQRILEQNTDWLVAEAERQLMTGMNKVVIA